MSIMENDITVTGVEQSADIRISMKSKKRAAFFATSAISLAMSTMGYAATVTVPAGPTTEAAVDVLIAANPDPDLTLDIKAGAEITGAGGGDVDIIPAGAVNSGAITVINAGSIGTVTAGVITNDTGLAANGVGKLDAKNTASVTNSGLITGGLTVGQFGSTVVVSNSGSIHNGILANGFKDVTATTTSTGAVLSGLVQLNSFATSTPTTVGGVTTVVNSSGNAKIVQQGNAASADGLTKVDLRAFADVGSVDITVSKLAGNVRAQASLGAFAQQVFGGDPAAAGKTVTTSLSEQTLGTGKANVTIEAGADVNNVQAFGAGGGTVLIDGKANAVDQATFGVNNTTFKATETQDAVGKVTQLTSFSSSSPAGGNQTLKIGSTGAVASFVSVQTNGGKADATVDGSIGSTLFVQAGANKTGSAATNNISATTGLSTDKQNSSFSTAVGGAVTLAVGSTGSIVGAATAQTNAGTVDATINGKLGST